MGAVADPSLSGTHHELADHGRRHVAGRHPAASGLAAVGAVKRPGDMTARAGQIRRTRDAAGGDDPPRVRL